MKIDEFTEKLQSYSIDDFVNAAEKPYEMLIEAAEWKIGLFKQYSAIMLKHVEDQTKDNKIISYVKGKIGIGEMMIYNRDFTNIISEYINTVAIDKDTSDKVSVLPLLCGSGKSTALTLHVINTIIRIEGAQLRAKDIREGLITEEFLDLVKTEEGEDTDTTYFTEVAESEFDGLLIVTDNKERLYKIWNPDPNNKYIDDGLRSFIDDYQEDWVSIMTEDNSDEEERKQRYSPVLCITTQRYFGWRKEEILKHLEWEDDNGVHRRPLVIFDEQPYLNEVRDITVNTINDIDTALRTCLDDKVSKEKKHWCRDQWRMFRDWIFALMEYYEYELEGLDTLYFEPKGNSITEDDEQFFGFIEAHRSKLRTRNKDYYKDILTVKQFMNSWSVFNHRDIITGEYSNKFSVFIDNRDKVTNLGAKVIILDGTGDISPIYAGQDYIDIRDGSNFLRSLSYLTIRLGNFDTSKEQFRKCDVSKPILAYLKKQGYEKKDMVFFTYKGKDSKFQARVNGKLIRNVAHFGNIRGDNDFTTENAFAQVGINRMQPVHYLVHVLARHDDMRENLEKRDPESMYEQIQAIYNDDRYIDFLTDHVLADIDQCMFRSAIRDADNLQLVIYYIFYKPSQYPRLKTEIENRYHEKLGANIEPVIQETDIWDAVGAEKHAWRIRKWLAEEWEGKPIRQKEIREELNIGRDSFNSALRRDKELSLMFKEYNQNAKMMGYKGAWYAKTCS